MVRIDTICPDGCVYEIKVSCIEYSGDDLTNIDIEKFDSGTDILEALNGISYVRTPFVANSTNTIFAIGGGVLGHSPIYNVRLDPNVNNLITYTSEGLMVDKTSGGDGKVRVSVDDPKAYLMDQLGESVTDFVTVTPQKVDGGKVAFISTLNIPNLIAAIEADFTFEFCQIINDCTTH